MPVLETYESGINGWADGNVTLAVETSNPGVGAQSLAAIYTGSSGWDAFGCVFEFGPADTSGDDQLTFWARCSAGTYGMGPGSFWLMDSGFNFSTYEGAGFLLTTSWQQFTAPLSDFNPDGLFDPTLVERVQVPIGGDPITLYFDQWETSISTPPVLSGDAAGAGASSGSATGTLITPAIAAGDAAGAGVSSGSASGVVITPPIAAGEALGAASSAGTAEGAVITPALVSGAALAVASASGSARGVLSSTDNRPTEDGFEMGSIVNRSRILSHVAWALSRITRANGYPVTVGEVWPFFRSYDDVRRENMPAVCVFPAQGQRAPRYLLASLRDEYLRFDVIAHVAGDHHGDRTWLLSALEAAIVEELASDPTCGGWAIHTTRVGGGDSDEGTPERAGHTDGTATLVTTFEAVYTPGLQNRSPMRYASAYVATSAPTTLSSGVFAAPAGTWAAGPLEAPAFTLTASTGRLAYLRERELEFLASASLSVLCASAGVLSARLAVNGVDLERTQVDVSVSAGAVALLAIEDIVELEQNDTLSIEIAHTMGQDVTVQRGVVRLAPVSPV